MSPYGSAISPTKPSKPAKPGEADELAAWAVAQEAEKEKIR